MRNTEKTNDPLIMINGGTKTYQVTLAELTEFLDTCESDLRIRSTKDIKVLIEEITDAVVDGTRDNLTAEILKRQLKFLRELTFMFMGVLYEREPVS